MKKVLAMVLAMLMMAVPVFAESVEETAAPEERVRVAVLEGMEEEILEYQYECEGIYTMWYDYENYIVADFYGHPMFVPVDETAEEHTASFMVVVSEIAVENADALLGEAVGNYDPENVGEVLTVETEQGTVVKSIEVTEEDHVTRFYLVVGETQVLCITAEMPIDALEGAGVRFDWMAQSIEFVESAE